MKRRDFLHGVGAVMAARSFDRLVAQPSTRQPVRTVRTSVLDIAYHETGDSSSVPVILLHGFPDDAHAYDGVAPLIAKAGCRAFAVYLRGFAPTTYLDPAAPRMAEQAAIGQDVIDFADALGLQRFAVAGFDWGGRAACVAAALNPERVCAAVLVSGYTIQNTVTPGRPAPPDAARRLWYQWYFNTDAGRRALEQNRRGLCRLLWQEWSPTWKFSDDLFALTAASWDNPDFVDCVVHSYRHRNFNAPGEPRFVEVEQRLAKRPPIEAPTIVLYGADDSFGHPAADITAADRAVLPKIVDKRIVAGAGHFLPHEKPAAVAAAIIDALAAS